MSDRAGQSTREVLRKLGLMLLGLIAAIVLAEFLTRWLVTVRDVGPSFTVHDPVLGKRIKANFRAVRITPEFTMRISTNSHGFRGPELPLGNRPILFLGDSFTLGYGVSDGEEYPARVGASLQKLYGAAAPPVVNAGVGNSGNGYWVRFLRREGESIRPRLVVMQVFENDFEDNVRERLFELAQDGSLLEIPVPPPGAMRRLQGLIEAIPGASQSYLVGLVRQVLAREGGTRGQRGAGSVGNGKDDRLTMAILEASLDACEARGWRTMGLLVGLPEPQQERVAALFARRGAPALTIPSKSQRPDLYYAVDGHWHADGHAFVAGRVLEAMLPLTSTVR